MSNFILKRSNWILLNECEPPAATIAIIKYCITIQYMEKQKRIQSVSKITIKIAEQLSIAIGWNKSSSSGPVLNEF